MKKVFIIEDNDKDYLTLLKIVTDNFADVEVYPSNLDDNKLFRKMLKGFFSPNDRINSIARAYMTDLKINDYDGVLLDYELFPSVRLVTGIQFYTEMKLTIKALILTKYGGVKLTQINDIIQNQKLNQILVTQKGNLVVLSEEQKEEHVRNINHHIFGQNDNFEVELKKRIIDKLNYNKPKLGAASDSTNKDIFRITEELITKLDSPEFKLNDIENKLEFVSDEKYLQILNELNS